MKQTEQEKRNAVYDNMNVSEELRQKAENFASSGKTKTQYECIRRTATESRKLRKFWKDKNRTKYKGGLVYWQAQKGGRRC